MALYENGKRISGIRDFPAYTWDEYHALPVAKRPKVWKCTDRDYVAIKTLTVTSGSVAGGFFVTSLKASEHMVTTARLIDTNNHLMSIMPSVSQAGYIMFSFVDLISLSIVTDKRTINGTIYYI